MNLLGLNTTGTISSGMMVLWIAIVVWSLAWKGWALWRAAQNKSVAWYVILLVLNTVGILEIIYIFFFSGYGKQKA